MSQIKDQERQLQNRLSALKETTDETAALIQRLKGRQEAAISVLKSLGCDGPDEATRELGILKNQAEDLRNELEDMLSDLEGRYGLET